MRLRPGLIHGMLRIPQRKARRQIFYLGSIPFEVISKVVYLLTGEEEPRRYWRLMTDKMGQFVNVDESLGLCVFPQFGKRRAYIDGVQSDYQPRFLVLLGFAASEESAKKGIGQVFLVVQWVRREGVGAPQSAGPLKDLIHAVIYFANEIELFSLVSERI